MKKRASALMVLIAVMLALLVSGCGHISDGNASSLEIEKDGTVRASSVESFDRDYYSEDELEEAVRESIKQYNAEAGGEQVYLESCGVKNGYAKLILFYRTAEDYASFNHVTLWNGTLADAVSSGRADRSLEIRMLQKSDGGTSTAGAILDGDGKKDRLLIVEEPLTVQVPGEIVGGSSGITINQDGTARAGLAGDTAVTLDAPEYILYQ